MRTNANFMTFKMILTLRKFYTCVMRLQCLRLFMLVAIAMPFPSEALFGDSCTMKSSPGVCKLASQCPELEMAVRAGTFSSRDIVNCGFATREEIICCPTTTKVGTENRSDDKFFFEQSPTTSIPISTTTTSTTTTTEANNNDFWSHLLTTPTNPQGNEEDVTTTPKPDFWVHLLSTIPTTTTTTVKPLIINGKEVDPNARFIDLTAMLSDDGREEEQEREAVPDNRFHNSNIVNRSPTSINDRTFGWQNPPMGIPNPTVDWNVQQPRQFSQTGMQPFKPNPGMPFANNARNFQQQAFRSPSSPLNIGNNNFVQQPMGRSDFNRRSPSPRDEQNFFTNRPGEMSQNRNENRPFSFPVADPLIETRPTQQFENDWNTRQGPVPNLVQQSQSPIKNNRNIFTGRPTIEFQDNNDISQTNPLSESIWPKNDQPNGPMSSPLKQLEQPAALSRTPMQSKIIFPSKTERNPIETVNENLIKSGIEIISAKLENVQRGSNNLRTENIPDMTTPSTTSSSVPFAPFQFRPPPEENFERNIGKSEQLLEPIKSFNDLPIWSIEKSNGGKTGSDDDGSTRVTTSTTPKTTISPVTTRNNDRPAVIACREIDRNLDPGLTPHILGGTPAELGEFPHMAAIGYSTIGNEQGPYEYRCGGTLIASRFVLTAAHCVNRRDIQPAVVLLGLVDINDPEERQNAVEVPIRQIHIHPEYSNSRTYHDVSVLELERDVKYSEFIYPTCLNTDLNDPPPNAVTYVTGWGQINTSTRQKSDILLKAKLQVVPVEQCNASYVEMGLNRHIREGVQAMQMCAHDPGFTRDACQGDSGGPLTLVVDESLKKYRIIGIISAGFSCASATPGLYARVAAYLDYIEGIVWPNKS